ncbi:MAG TPA: hypothetical protein VIZ65_05825 [Cellvibrionaceae bacterium]
MNIKLGYERGMALLAILGLLLLIFTTALIASVSHNTQSYERGKQTSLALAAVRDALMGYSLMANTKPEPPGSLPCPAQNRQGSPVSINVATGKCAILRGLVPYRILGIGEPLDGSGAPIWYAPDADLAGTTNNLRNSSGTSKLSLKISSANRTEAVAFVLVAPNQPIGAQQPNTATTLVAAEFLEGINGAANTTQYDDLKDAQHNDQILAMPLGQFWTQIEQRVFKDIAKLLQEYLDKCKLHPWAAGWLSKDGMSLSTVFAGSVPLVWPPDCSGEFAPAPPADDGWLRTHWSGLFYYAICDLAGGNPPNAGCLQVTTPTGIKAAKVIAIAPGAVLTGQDRSQVDKENYFEALNADNNTGTFTQMPVNQHTQTFNDVLFIIQ